jgi:NADH:ubiquinone oxidoreductase subunit 6 (subunit J)
MGGTVSFIWWMLAVAVVIVWVISLLDIFRRRLGAAKTAAWVLLVIILPLVGSIIYWALRKPEPGDAQRTADAERARREQAARRPFDSTGF